MDQLFIIDKISKLKGQLGVEYVFSFALSEVLTLAFALLWEDVSSCFKLQLDVKQDFFFFHCLSKFFTVVAEDLQD